jgi:hypothetical protein
VIHTAGKPTQARGTCYFHSASPHEGAASQRCGSENSPLRSLCQVPIPIEVITVSDCELGKAHFSPSCVYQRHVFEAETLAMADHVRRLVHRCGNHIRGWDHPSKSSLIPVSIYNGTSATDMFKLDQSGNATVTGNVTATNATNIVFRCTVAGTLPWGH